MSASYQLVPHAALLCFLDPNQTARRNTTLSSVVHREPVVQIGAMPLESDTWLEQVPSAF